MSSDAETNDPEELEQEIKESIERARDLTDEYRIVQEHESTILETDAAHSNHAVKGRACL